MLVSSLERGNGMITIPYVNRRPEHVMAALNVLMDSSIRLTLNVAPYKLLATDTPEDALTTTLRAKMFETVEYPLADHEKNLTFVGDEAEIIRRMLRAKMDLSMDVGEQQLLAEIVCPELTAAGVAGDLLPEAVVVLPEPCAVHTIDTPEVLSLVDDTDRVLIGV